VRGRWCKRDWVVKGREEEVELTPHITGPSTCLISSISLRVARAPCAEVPNLPHYVATIYCHGGCHRAFIACTKFCRAFAAGATINSPCGQRNPSPLANGTFSNVFAQKSGVWRYPTPNQARVRPRQNTRSIDYGTRVSSSHRAFKSRSLHAASIYLALTSSWHKWRATQRVG